MPSLASLRCLRALPSTEGMMCVAERGVLPQHQGRQVLAMQVL